MIIFSGRQKTQAHKFLYIYEDEEISLDLLKEIAGTECIGGTKAWKKEIFYFEDKSQLIIHKNKVSAYSKEDLEETKREIEDSKKDENGDIYETRIESDFDYDLDQDEWIHYKVTYKNGKPIKKERI